MPHLQKLHVLPPSRESPHGISSPTQAHALVGDELPSVAVQVVPCGHRPSVGPRGTLHCPIEPNPQGAPTTPPQYWAPVGGGQDDVVVTVLVVLAPVVVLVIGAVAGAQRNFELRGVTARMPN